MSFQRYSRKLQSWGGVLDLVSRRRLPPPFRRSQLPARHDESNGADYLLGHILLNLLPIDNFRLQQDYGLPNLIAPKDGATRLDFKRIPMVHQQARAGTVCALLSFCSSSNAFTQETKSDN